MLNISLQYLNAAFLLSNSPLLSYNQKQINTQIHICHFLYSFANIYYSNSNQFQSVFRDSIFSHILNNSIFISENVLLISVNISQRRSFTNSENKNITIVNCIFDNCITDQLGGAIYITQNCTIIIYGTTFNFCRSQNGSGGFICAFLNSGEDIIYSMQYTISTIVKYCCFYRCFAHVVQEDIPYKGFGNDLLVSSDKTELFYITALFSIFEEEISFGANFDIKSPHCSVKYLNNTQSTSAYSGSVELRTLESGDFKFNTISNIEGKFVTRFDAFGTFDFSNCNYIEDVTRGDFYENNYPCLIGEVFFEAENLKNKFNISSCIVVKCQFLNNGIFVESLENHVTITIINCFCDNYVFTDIDDYNQINSNLNYGNDLEIEIYPYVNIGECHGDVEVPDFFTPSNFFSNSMNFSLSEIFSVSDFFSNSIEFTFSGSFTKSSSFSESIVFTESSAFTESDHFTVSNIFTKSDQFSVSNIFIESDQFSVSNIFTESDHFSVSNIFTESDHFSVSNIFTESDHFTVSNIFTKSDQFSVSNIFTKSDQFSVSNIFTESDQFFDSNPFTFSNSFSESNQFNLSNVFIISNHFLKSDLFSKSFTMYEESTSNEYFSNINSESNTFSYSNMFSNMSSSSKSGSYSLTITLTYTMRRSVSFSISFYSSYSYSYFNEQFILINSGYFSYFPYIINFMFSTYTQTYILISLNIKKKIISKEQLIGIVCGCTAAFFLILYIIIYFFMKKRKYLFNDDFSYSISDENIENTKINKESQNLNIQSPSDNENDLDFWL